MVVNRCVTSDVHIRSGALIPLFLGGLGWPLTTSALRLRHEIVVGKF